MVHMRSADSRLVRRERAIYRGYITRRRSPRDYCQVISPNTIGSDATSVMDAERSARDDPMDDAVLDPLTLCDPWFGAHMTPPCDKGELSDTGDAMHLWADYKPPIPPPRGWVSADAIVGGPWTLQAPPQECYVVQDAKDELIHAQNNTIALLTSRLERCCHNDADPHCGLSLQKQINKLAASLPEVVETSLAKRIPMEANQVVASLQETIHKPAVSQLDPVDALPGESPLQNDSSLQKRFYELVRPHIVDVLDIVESSTSQKIEALRTALTDVFLFSVKKLLKQYDSIIQEQLTLIRRSVPGGTPSDVAASGGEDYSDTLSPGEQSLLSCETPLYENPDESSGIGASTVEDSLPPCVRECNEDVAASGGVSAAEIDMKGNRKPSIGDTVRIHGLVQTPHHNGRFARILGVDTETGRFMLRSSAKQPAIKVKAANFEYPAHCQHCRSEVTSSMCYACDNESPPVLEEASSYAAFGGDGAENPCEKTVAKPKNLPSDFEVDSELSSDIEVERESSLLVRATC